MKKNNIRQKNIDENLSIPAKKLAVLLYNSNMPDDIKTSWISLLPSMSLEQIDNFLNILEAKYLDEQTRDIDKKLKKQLEDLVKKYKKEDWDYSEKLLEQIEEVNKTI